MDENIVREYIAKAAEVTGLPHEAISLGIAVFLLIVLYFLLFGGRSVDMRKRVLKRREALTKVALVKDEWIELKLIDKEEVSHDVRRFRFALPSKEHTLGLPIGQHISFRFINSEGKEVIRSYTPVTSDDEKGYVDIVVKVYKAIPERNIPPGAMGTHLNNLKVGVDSILARGPKGHLDYYGRGQFSITKKNEMTLYNKQKIGMIAGGTGITPMLQVIRAIMKDPSDNTQVWLLFANQTEDDILLRKELEALPKDRVRVHYTLDRPPEDGSWKYSKGFINADMCKAHLPPPGHGTMIFNCGPPVMIQRAIEPSLKALGFDESQWFNF